MVSTTQGQDKGKSDKPKAGSQGSKRGFASMDEEIQREIASQGGQAAHQKGTAHEFDSEEARRAGQKGGEEVSKDRAHMAEIGRKGGKSSHQAGSRGEEIEDENSEENEESSRKQPQTRTRGSTSEQHSQAGRQSPKNQ